MVNPQHLAWLREGVEGWNQRRRSSTSLPHPNLSGAYLVGAELSGAYLLGADLTGANLAGANLSNAKLDFADLSKANLGGADLRGASLVETELFKADLFRADLRWADLEAAVLMEAKLLFARLEHARLIRTNLRGAELTSCKVYGVSVWDAQIDERTKQDSLVITPTGQPEVSVDNLEVAQFVYLMLTSPKLRNVIDTVGRKAVLILGRFTPERKVVLDAIRVALRERGYVPILFDFVGPENRNLTETVSILARLSRFVIADLTEPRSVPHELMSLARDLPSVPVAPLILSGENPYGMFPDLLEYEWVLDPYEYTDAATLTAALDSAIITPAEQMAERRIARRMSRARR